MSNSLIHGDCLSTLSDMDSDQVDSIVTDPPYGISFMGKRWDYDVPSIEIWMECLRVLKPGGHLLSFAGTRTQHRMCVNIEDAGFEIRDMIAWIYGSGFPKSHNIGKAIDKAVGAEREVVGHDPTCRLASNTNLNDDGWSKIGTQGADITAPATDEAKQWEGWGTALKPALEPITLARKPFNGTVANNVLEYGTGAISVDESRVPLNGDYKSRSNGRPSLTGLGDNYDPTKANQPDTLGRFPANLIHDGDPLVLDIFPDRQDRFFYCAKASRAERGGENHHPTVKPISLMRYLCKLITPPGGVVLDPFMGSGSTGIAAWKEGFNFIGIEMDEEYFQISEERIKGSCNE